MMYDLTQFFVSTITTETHAEHLAKLVIVNAVLSIIMVSIIAVDANSRFDNVFKYISTSLGFVYWPLAHGNHKGMRIEQYHCFLNKTQAIAGQDRDTHDVFLQNAKTSQYAWNSIPIDGSDILRSVAAVCHEFCFSLDVELLQNPTTRNQGNSVLYEYPRHVSDKYQFVTLILQILVEE